MHAEVGVIGDADRHAAVSRADVQQTSDRFAAAEELAEPAAFVESAFGELERRLIVWTIGGNPLTEPLAYETLKIGREIGPTLVKVISQSSQNKTSRSCVVG